MEVNCTEPFPSVRVPWIHYQIVLGWNACSSCYDNPNKSRNRLIVPALGSSRIYSIDVNTDPRKPEIDKVLGYSGKHCQYSGLVSCLVYCNVCRLVYCIVCRLVNFNFCSLVYFNVCSLVYCNVCNLVSFLHLPTI
jgi:hypothetical protein